jgi:hypothetical protein
MQERERELSLANRALAARDSELQQCRSLLLQADHHSARAAGDLRTGQHTSAYVSIRQHTSAAGDLRTCTYYSARCGSLLTYADVCAAVVC